MQLSPRARIKPHVSIDGVEIDLEKTRPGSITLEQYEKVRANSPGFEALYPLLNNEALIKATEYAVKNSSPRPVTYEWALMNSLIPELVKRLKEANP